MSFCKNDADSIYEVLYSVRYHIPNEKKLVGNVNWDRMRKAIIDFFDDSSISPDDTLIFYYSGHGVPDTDGDVYLATSEIEPASPYRSGFSFGELTKMAHRTIATRVVLILDCCYGGSLKISKGHEDNAARLGLAYVDNQFNTLSGEGICLLASSQASQEAFALVEKDHSLYTYYLLRGLSGKDRGVLDKHGNITVDTLSKYVYDKIMSLPFEKRPKQKPLRKIESSGDIILIDKACFPKFFRKSENKEEQKHQILHKYSTTKDHRRITEEIKPVNDYMIDEYKHRQLRYGREVAMQNSEKSKAFLFLEFIRDVFKDIQAAYPHNLYPELEKYIASNKTVLIRGIMDAFLGNLIIEFESNLRRNRGNCESQLRRYTAILWNNKGKVNYLCIATDGLEFSIFRPRSSQTNDFTEDSIKLEIVDTFDMRADDPITIYKRLDRYILYRTLTPPSAEDIVEYFGYESLIFSDSISLLEEAWKNVKYDSLTLYKEWSKYLSIVYGSNVQNEQLFLRHTYLATLAKLMVFAFYQENTIPTSHSVIERILKGDIFREWNIENFLVEDFFSWILRSDAYKYGIQTALRILDGLERYDLTKLNEDVLKELYQQLVDPSERHYLGEFYTPDWLAQMMTMEVVTDVNFRILDPACGSGTFLASAIRYKISLMTETQGSKKVDLIIRTISGIDVHPLAVLISKANYLMAIGDILKWKKGALTIPVYMADSIIFPLPIPSVARYNSEPPEELYHYPIDSQTELVLPKGLVEAESADSILDNIKEFADKKIKDPTLPDRGFLSYLAKKYGVTQEYFEIIIETVDTLINLIRKGKDSIHPFILKNIYKPSIIGKFDVVIGNPPWLSYRYVRSTERQGKLKKLIIEDYKLLNSSDENLITHMEMATLFFVRSADLYLRESGSLAFVLPRSVFTGDQHKNFRENLFNLKLGFKAIYDLEKNQKERVSPLFSVESCVLFAQKGMSTRYPIPTKLMTGRLPKKNSTFTDIVQLMDSKNFRIVDQLTVLTKVGERTSWNYGDEIKIGSEKSPYMTKFKQGATIVPRMFWFVDTVPPHKFFVQDVDEPLMESSKRSLLMANKEYKGISLRGKVEERYLYATLLGSDIFPFCNLEPRIVVLPVDSSAHSFRMIKKEEVQARGDSNMFQWLSHAEQKWREVRKEKTSTMTIYQRLDRNRGITIQRPDVEYVVLYNSAGRRNMVSCVLKTNETLRVRVNGNHFNLHGFIADHKCYLYYPRSQKEAYYLAAIINSDFAFSVLSKIKSARDIHKKIWEIPVPEFNQEHNVQSELSEIGERCTTVSKGVLHEEVKKLSAINTLQTGTVGNLRKKIKKTLEQDIKRINTLVASLVGTKST